MSDVNFLKKSVVKVQERSPFDKSFRNLLTTKCGTLTPLLCDEVIPNTTVNLKIALTCTLPPLASETFMNVNLKTEAFFIPLRLLMLGFEDWVQGNTAINVGSTSANATEMKLRVPLIKLDNTNDTPSSLIAPGSLADYLGYKCGSDPFTTDMYINCLPFLAYHLVWSCWYRNPLVQQDCFSDNSFYSTVSYWLPSYMKLKKPIDGTNQRYITSLKTVLRDGTYLGSLRQRNFGADLFTMATPSPQNGPAQKISMSLPDYLYFNSDVGSIKGQVDSTEVAWDNSEQGQEAGWSGTIQNSSSDSSSVGVSFTIQSLRACNAIQQWLERNNLSSNQYVSFLKAQFNANLQDSIAQRPVYLGSASFPVYSKGVYQTSADSNSGNNPFDSVGSRYGHAYAEGTDFIIDHFTAEEPGYIMVLASLVPEVTYSSGVAPILTRYLEADSYGEMANPILQNVGPEPIYVHQIIDTYDSGFDNIFGYVDRFANWMTKTHELHGLLRDGQSLESFALQRDMYGVNLAISDSFLKIPTSYMDQVTAVDSAISNYGVWIDSYLDYKVVQPLGKYVVPSLQDPAYEHGQTVVVNRRGRVLD